MRAPKHIGVVAWCGIAACIGLSAWSGIDDVGNAIASVGWGASLVVLTRAATVSIAAAGCRGLPVTAGEALVIESLMQAVRGAAFAVPSGLGAQEAGLILLCGMFQIPPDQALALSFVKRAADVVVGVPGLVALQILEGKRFGANYSGRAAQSPMSLDLKSD